MTNEFKFLVESLEGRGEVTGNVGIDGSIMLKQNVGKLDVVCVLDSSGSAWCSMAGSCENLLSLPVP